MATHHNTFTALGNNSRDLSASIGDVYTLDGNASNGRINSYEAGSLTFGDYTTIQIVGNTGHSYNNGSIFANYLTYVLQPGGGRSDYGASSTVYDLTDARFIALGSGEVFHHMQSETNRFRGSFTMFANMSDGNLYLQFGSFEVPGFTLDVHTNNAANIVLYPARLSAGFTSFPGFTVRGLSDTDTLTVYKGDDPSAAGRIYDPDYVGVTNNLLSIRRNIGGAANNALEYFTIEVTNLRDDDARIRVVSGADLVSGTVQHDMNLTQGNTTIYANDATTALSYYSGRNVVPCLVRTITTAVSTSRDNISYRIRRPGFLEVSANNQIMNAPVVLGQMAEDENYTAPAGMDFTTLTELNSSEALYNYSRYWLAQNLTVDDFMSRVGDTIVSSLPMVLDAGASSVFSVSGGIVTVKSSAFMGSVTINGGGVLTLRNGATVGGVTLDANGDSQANITLPTGFDTVTLHASAQDADDGTNALFSGVRVRYQSAIYGGQTLWMRISDSTIPGREIVVREDVPPAPGTYNFVAAAFSENDQLREINAKIDGLTDITALARDHARAANVQTRTA